MPVFKWCQEISQKTCILLMNVSHAFCSYNFKGTECFEIYSFLLDIYELYVPCLCDVAFKIQISYLQSPSGTIVPCVILRNKLIKADCLLLELPKLLLPPPGLSPTPCNHLLTILQTC